MGWNASVRTRLAALKSESWQTLPMLDLNLNSEGEDMPCAPEASDTAGGGRRRTAFGLATSRVHGVFLIQASRYTAG